MEHKAIVNGVELNYSQGGQGRPMIIMHGWGSEHAAMSIFERVGHEQHEVFNLDLPGFGKSQEPPTPWGIEEYTQMLEEFVRQNGLENPIIVGHSFGGRIAILYASRNPVDRLVLVDAAGLKSRRSLSYYYKVYSLKLAKSFLHKIPFVSKEWAEARIEKMKASRGSADYKNASPMMRRVMVKAVNTDLRKQLPQIEAPTLLLWGENDTATPMRDAHTMNKLIKNSTLVSFPGAGHFSFVDNPYQSAAVFRRFIQPAGTNPAASQQPETIQK